MCEEKEKCFCFVVCVGDVAIRSERKDIRLLNGKNMAVSKVRKEVMFLKEKGMCLYGGHINMSRV